MNEEQMNEILKAWEDEACKAGGHIIDKRCICFNCGESVAEYKI